jgi:signal transduction histidine kinase
MQAQIPPLASDELAAALLQAVITAALAALCVFLYRRHRKPYFAWFAAAWTLYLLRLGAIGSFLLSGARPWLYVHQVITGLTALALLWAALVFSRGLAWRWRYLGVALFPPLWSIVAIYRLDSFLLAAAPMVAFLSLATLWSGWTFLDYHRRVDSAGARLLAVAFFLWGLHHLDYPFLRARGAWTPWGYYLDSLFELAVGAGILVLVLDDLRRGLSALSALSGDLQRGGDVLGTLLQRPLELPAVRGTAYFTEGTVSVERGAWSGEATPSSVLHAPRATLTCIRGEGSCAAWTDTHPEGDLAELLERVMLSGRPQVAPGVAGHASVAALPVLSEGAATSAATGALVLAGDARDPFTALDEGFLRALGQQVGAALHHAALYDQLGARTAELERLSARMLRQHEEERRRLSRELHDETAQVFTAVKMQLGVLRADLPERRERLDRVLGLIDTGIRSIRSVTNDLRPSLLDDLGLLPALRSLCADFQERSGVRTTLDAPATLPPLPEDADLALFRAMQEGLSNVARHAGASAVHVTVEVTEAAAGAPPAVTLTVRDDGAGVVTPADLARWEREGHMGLVGMRERIGALGGTVALGSGNGRRGAVLRVRVPLVTAAVQNAGRG